MVIARRILKAQIIKFALRKTTKETAAKYTIYAFLRPHTQVFLLFFFRIAIVERKMTKK